MSGEGEERLKEFLEHYDLIRLAEILAALKDIWLWLHMPGGVGPFPPPGDPMETREFRKRLLANQKLLEDLSIAIDRVLQEHKVKLREGMTYAFVPIVFEKPKMIHEISNWCDSRTNMVAILEPSLVKTLGKLRVEEIKL